MSFTKRDLYNSSEFAVALLHDMVHSKATMDKAKEVGLKPDDFLLGKESGDFTQYLLAQTLLTMDTHPIVQSNLIMHCGVVRKNYPHIVVLDSMMSMLIWRIYVSTHMESSYFREHMKDFVKTKRAERIANSIDDPERIIKEFEKLNLELSSDSWIADVKTGNPFRDRTLKCKQAVVPTGLLYIDKRLGGGSHYGEYNLLLGSSGSGKTAFATSLVYNAALNGKTAAYLSLEEQWVDLYNRFRANEFNLDYSGLHSGRTNGEEQRLHDEWLSRITPRKRALMDNLFVDDLKDTAPVSVKQIFAFLEQRAAKVGFAPDLVVIDQFQFLEPSTGTAVGDGKFWEKDKVITAELDWLSQQTIMGKPFSLWVMHQTKGKLKQRYDNTEIDGFKGIIHKADNVFTIGKESPESEDYVFASVKCRHNKNFHLPLKGVLQHMRFVSVDPKEADSEYIPEDAPEVPPHGYMSEPEAIMEEDVDSAIVRRQLQTQVN